MSTGLDALIGQIASSRAANGGNYIRDGRYTMMLKSITVEDLFKGDTLVAELEVLESEDDSTAKADNGNPIKANPKGDVVSFIQQFKEHPMTAFSATKALILALLEEDEASCSADQFSKAFKNAVGKDQPLRGTLVKCSTYRKLTKDKSKLLVLPKWTSVPQTEEEIAGRRKALDGAAQPAA